MTFFNHCDTSNLSDEYFMNIFHLLVFIIILMYSNPTIRYIFLIILNFTVLICKTQQFVD